MSAAKSIALTKAPVIITNDTLSFYLKTFKSNQKISVKALLKKVPNIKIDKNDKITLYNKPINTLLVNGKVFLNKKSLMIFLVLLKTKKTALR